MNPCLMSSAAKKKPQKHIALIYSTSSAQRDKRWGSMPRICSVPCKGSGEKKKRRVKSSHSVSTDRCEFFHALRWCNEQSRQFFTTEKGYMGFGPPTLQPGDDIYVFFGGVAPFTLRKQESTPSFEQPEYYIQSGGGMLPPWNYARRGHERLGSRHTEGRDI
jgi:hypothetical protein